MTHTSSQKMSPDWLFIKSLSFFAPKNGYFLYFSINFCIWANLCKITFWCGSRKVFKSEFIICLICNTKKTILLLLKIIEKLQLMYWKGLFISSWSPLPTCSLVKIQRQFINGCHILFLCQCFTISFNQR